MRTTHEPDGTSIVKANSGITDGTIFQTDTKQYSCGPLDNWSNTEQCDP